MQEAFARLLRSRFDYRGEGTLEAWAWRTVTNVALTYGSRARSRPGPLAPERESVSNGVPPRWPELRAAVAALPDRQRQTLFLRHYADLSYDEIADVLGVARGTVSATLHSAHAALREAIPELRQ